MANITPVSRPTKKSLHLLELENLNVFKVPRLSVFSTTPYRERDLQLTHNFSLNLLHLVELTSSIVAVKSTVNHAVFREERVFFPRVAILINEHYASPGSLNLDILFTNGFRFSDRQI